LNFEKKSKTHTGIFGPKNKTFVNVRKTKEQKTSFVDEKEVSL